MAATRNAKFLLRRSLVCVAMAALALPAASSWAARGHGGHPHFAGHPHFHHRFGPRIGFALVGPPAFFYPYPFAYVPVVPAQPPAPVIYIERFDGTPKPGMTGIVCPSAGGAPYPDVSECPGGWARTIQDPAPPPSG